MKLRAKTMIACPYGLWQRGDLLELPDAMAVELVRNNHAESLEPVKVETAALEHKRRSRE